MKDSKRSSRRQLLIGAAIGGGLLASREKARADAAGQLGTPLGPYGERSPFEKAVRWRRESKTPETGSSFTPLQDSVGMLTPSSLHYERHHSGIPNIDPAQHRLVIHGMVNRPLSLSVAEIRRLPSVSRTLVLECGGNSGSEWVVKGGPDVQRSYGLVSCSEWTGVPLSLLLTEVGVQPGASWVIDRRRPYPDGSSVTEDAEDQDLRVSNDMARTRRGGSFSYDWSTVRSAHRGATTYFPIQTRDSVGFRIARTMR